LKLIVKTVFATEAEHKLRWSVLLVLLAAIAAAEIIDRIAVSVGNQVITASDLDRQIRVAAFLDGVPPQFTSARKHAAAQSMIEQKLIQVELTNSRYPLPDPAELVPIVDVFRKEHFQGDEQKYLDALAAAGITENDFKELLLWQRTLLLFIQVRFETGVQLTSEEVEQYFENTVKPAALAAHPGQAVTLEDYRSQIERTLSGQRADKEMDAWLRDVRRRTVIVIHEEVLQ
jgi:peptidyl-prolyl cis-trans isomerase SurA